eukprot:3439760-Amphidinium_carterae.1
MMHLHYRNTQLSCTVEHWEKLRTLYMANADEHAGEPHTAKTSARSCAVVCHDVTLDSFTWSVKGFLQRDVVAVLVEALRVLFDCFCTSCFPWQAVSSSVVAQ